MKEPLILKRNIPVPAEVNKTKVAQLPRTLASIDEELNNSFVDLKNHLEIKSSNIKHLVSEQKTNTTWFGSSLNRIGNFIVAIFDGKPLLDSLLDGQNKYDTATAKFIKKTDDRILVTKRNIDNLLEEKAQLTGNQENSQMQCALNALISTEKITSMLKVAELIKTTSKKNEANFSEGAIAFAKEVTKELAAISTNTHLQAGLNSSKAILEQAIKYSNLSDIQKTLLGQSISQISAVTKLAQAEETKKLIAFGQDNSILRANTFDNFFYYDFLPFAGTIAGGVLLATGVGVIGAGFIGGLIAMGVGGVIGSELIKEGQFYLTGKNKNLEHSTRSLIGAYLEGTKIGGDSIGATDVAISYGMQVGMSSLGSGSTQIAGKGIGTVLGWGLNKFGSSSLAKAILPTFTKFAENYVAKSLATESAKTATKSALELAHRYSARGLIKEVIEEFGEEGTEALMEQTAAHVGTQLKDQLGINSLGINIPFVSPEAALLIAFRRSGSHAAYFKGKQDYVSQLEKVSNLFLGENEDTTSGKSAEKIQQNLAASNIISPELASNLVGFPRFITATTAARELYKDPTLAPTIDQAVIEYNGQGLAGNKVKYRLWTKEGWNQLQNDLSQNIQYQALTILSKDPNQAYVINLVVDPEVDRVETLRTFFEEQYHVKRGYDGEDHHELTAKLYAEGMLKSLGFEHRTLEEIQTDVIRNYQATSKPTRDSNNKLRYNVAASAQTSVSDDNFDLQQAILSSPLLRTNDTINPEIFQQSEFEIYLNQILEQALDNKATLFEIETLVRQYLFWFKHKDSVGTTTKFTALEQEAFEIIDIIQSEGQPDESMIAAAHQAFENKLMPADKFQAVSLHYLARISRVLQKLRADKMYEEQNLPIPANLNELPLQEYFEYQRQILREREIKLWYRAEFFLPNVGLNEESNAEDVNAHFEVLPILLFRHSGMGPGSDITEHFLEPDNIPIINSERAVLWDATKVVRKINVVPTSGRNPAYLVVEFNTPTRRGTRVLRLAVAKNHIPAKDSNLNESLTNGFETDLSRFFLDNDTSLEARQAIIGELAKLGSASEKRLFYQDYYALRDNTDCYQLMANMLGRNEQERKAIYLNLFFDLSYDREDRKIDDFAMGIGSSKTMLIGSNPNFKTYNDGLWTWQKIRAYRLLLNRRDNPNTAHALNFLDANHSDSNPLGSDEFGRRFILPFLNLLITPAQLEAGIDVQLTKLLANPSDEDPWLLISRTDFNHYYYELNKFVQKARDNKFFDSLEKISNEIFPDTTNSDSQVPAQMRRLFQLEVLYEIFQGIMPNIRGEGTFRQNRKYFWGTMVEKAENCWLCDLAESRLWHLYFEGEKGELELGPIRNKIESLLLEPSDSSIVTQLENQIFNFHSLLRTCYLLSDPLRPTLTLKNLERPVLAWDKDQWRNKATLNSQLTTIANYLKADSLQLEQRLRNKEGVLKSYLNFFQDILAIRELYEAGRYEEAITILRKYIKKTGAAADSAKFPDSKKATESTWIESLRKLQLAINEKRNVTRTASQLATPQPTNDTPAVVTVVALPAPSTPIEAKFALLPSIQTVTTKIKQFFELLRSGQWVPDFIAFQRRGKDSDATHFAYDCTVSPQGSLSFISFNLGSKEVTFPMIPTHSKIPNEMINQSGQYQSVISRKQLSSSVKGADTRRELQREIDKLKVADTVSLDEQRRLLEMSLNILNEHHWSKQTAEELIESEKQKSKGTVDSITKVITDVHNERFQIYKLAAESRAELETLSNEKQIPKEQAISFVKAQIQKFSPWPRLRADWTNYLKQFESHTKLTPEFYYSEIVSSLEFACILARDPSHSILPIDGTLTADAYQSLFYPLSRLALKDQITQMADKQDISVFLFTQMLNSVIALSHNESITNTLIENAKPVSNTVGVFSEDKQYAAGIIYLDKDNKATKWVPGAGAHSGVLQANTRISPERISNNFDPNIDCSIAIVYPSTSAFPNPIQLQFFLDDIRRSPELQNISIILGAQSTDGNLYLYKLNATNGQAFSDIFGETFYHEACTKVFTDKFNKFLSPPKTENGLALLGWASAVKANFNATLKAAIASAYPLVDNAKIQLVVEKITKKYQSEIKEIKLFEVKDEKQFNQFGSKVSKLGTKIIADLLDIAGQEFFPIKEHFEPLVIPELSIMPPAWVVEKVADISAPSYQKEIEEIADRAFKKKGNDTYYDEDKKPATKAELLAFATIWVPDSIKSSGKANLPRFKEAWDKMIEQRTEIFADLKKTPESVEAVQIILDESSKILAELDLEKQKACQSLRSDFASSWAEPAINSIEQKLLTPSFSIIDPLKAEIDILLSVVDSKYSALFDQYQERVAKIKETHKKLVAIQSKLKDINTITTNMSVATLGIFIDNIKFATDYAKTTGTDSSMTQEIINNNAEKFWEIAQNIISQTPIEILPRTLSALERQFKAFMDITKGEEALFPIRTDIENTIPKTRTLNSVFGNIFTTKIINENFVVLAVNENVGLDTEILLGMGFTDAEAAQIRNSETKEDKDELLIKVVERTFNELEASSDKINEALSLREADSEIIKEKIAEGEELLRELLGINFLDKITIALQEAGSFDEGSLIIKNSLTIASNVLRRFPEDVQAINAEAMKEWTQVSFNKFKQFEITAGQNVSLVLPLDDGTEAVFKLDFLEQKENDGTFELSIPIGWTAYGTGAPFFVANGSSAGSKDWSNSIARDARMFTTDARSKQSPRLRLNLEPKSGDSQGLSTMLVFDLFELDAKNKEKSFPVNVDITGTPLKALTALVNKSPFKLLLIRRKDGKLTFHVESEYIDVMTIK